IRNAARTYFQKEPSLLTVGEAAVLIGMLKGNTIYNPRRNPVAAQKRRNVVLEQMVKNSFLSAEEAEKLKQQPIPLRYKKLDENAGLAPYFRDVLREYMKQWCKEHEKPNGDPYNLYLDGLKIYTTINPRMQLYAEEAVAKHLSVLQKNYWTLPWIKSKQIWKGRESTVGSRWKKKASTMKKNEKYLPSR
ncbi:MAG: transglycosylase domain-containing protein, partial [Chitinophagaceae bacterium]